MISFHKTISLFSGAMGLDIGLEQAGADIVIGQDYDSSCIKTMEQNAYKGISGDIRSIEASELLALTGMKRGEPFLICGGPPCQPFSTAGKRLGINDPRGSLFRDYLRMIDEIRPRFFVMENVKGLMSAKSDADHLHIILDSNPKMPSRQDAILNGGESPVPAMVATAQNLVKAGADVIIIGANTAHFFFDEVSSRIDVPFLHIIEEAVKETVRVVPNAKTIGVMATTAAMKAHVYEKTLEKFQMKLVNIPADMQDRMQRAIFDHDYGFKYNGRTEKSIYEACQVANYLIDNGAEALIMGCTEIPLILENTQFSVPLIDPNEVIAEVAVKYAKGL